MKPCPYDDPNCTGKHSRSVSKAEMCPSAHARKLESKRAGNMNPEALERKRSADREAQRKAMQDPELRERKRQRDRDYGKTERGLSRTRESVRRYNQTPKGREARREKDRAKRERKTGASYLDLTGIDNGRCYICGDTATEVEHVIPVARFQEYASVAEAPFSSGLRAVCAPCNRGPGGKFDCDPAEFFLSRWRSGLPVRQAIQL